MENDYISVLVSDRDAALRRCDFLESQICSLKKELKEAKRLLDKDRFASQDIIENSINAKTAIPVLIAKLRAANEKIYWLEQKSK